MNSDKNNPNFSSTTRFIALPSEYLNVTVSNEDDISMLEIVRIIWNYKLLVLAFCVVFGVVGIFYSLSLPNIYSSSLTIAPINKDQQSGVGGLVGQFGGLASLAGVNIGSSGTDKATIALEILKSKTFLIDFIKRRELLVPVMASKGWNPSSDQLIIDSKLYDQDAKVWVREVNPPKKAKPSMLEASSEFQKLFTVHRDKDTGLIYMTFQHYSPRIAKDWMSWLIYDLNETIKLQDIDEANKSIGFLQKKLQNVEINSNRSLLYELIEEQTKTLMFAQIREEYIFKTVDPPILPEDKVGPKRAFIVVLLTLVGGIFGIVSVLIYSLFKDRKNQTKKNTSNNLG